MNLLNFIFGPTKSESIQPIIFSIDMIIEDENTPTLLKDKNKAARFQEHFLYSFCAETPAMNWWTKSAFINHIDTMVEEESLAFFSETWQGTYTIAEEKTEHGSPHIIFLFPQPRPEDPPYSRTQAHIVATWLRKALETAKEEGQINAIADGELEEYFIAARIT